jgi:hypothetical protein
LQNGVNFLFCCLNRMGGLETGRTLTGRIRLTEKWIRTFEELQEKKNYISKLQECQRYPQYVGSYAPPLPQHRHSALRL